MLCCNDVVLLVGLFLWSHKFSNAIVFPARPAVLRLGHEPGSRAGSQSRLEIYRTRKHSPTVI